MNINIEGVKYSFFNNVTISMNFDSIASSFSISALFDPLNKTHRNLFKPISYQNVVITDNGQRLLTGKTISNAFSQNSEKAASPIVGYSKTGFLEDCTIPKSIYPLQFDNLSLKEIAEKVCAPFEIKVVIDQSVKDEADKVYPEIDVKNTDKIKDFLNSLCLQRDLILSHTAYGELLITKVNSEKQPIQRFQYNQVGVVNMKLETNGQNMHKYINVVGQQDSDSENAKDFTIENPFVSDFREITVVQNSGDDIDTEKYARSILGSQLKNIKLTIEYSSIRWSNGRIITPNEVILVNAPELTLYNTTKFFVESVSLQITESKEVAVLNCVLPDVYNTNKVTSIW